ncbi:hypothetical protein WHZ78_01735 [Bradyrhizobium symbiodeficiens]|uniref:hypothetical protein n=1 Tax=Bradyrhizobium symbiodeficiens TaxID=1404367 RepID=UPI0030D4B06F
MFFNDYYSFGGPPNCYLNVSGMRQCGPFLDTLIQLNRSEQTFLQAIVTLNFLEVEPTLDHLPLAILSAASWSQAYSENTNFWAEHGIGRRLCDWLDRILAISPDTFVVGRTFRKDVDQILAALVSLGIPEARRLETQLLNQDR